ncbi:protein bric-a-brac 1-like isoform X4 [Trichoplusia ni]|uniref:Protein bric-a-brac 1-like isoform X4 n=1 Tax=Trichoplusia ni TaxID=7111 RepID=A0A7E5WMW1_TRINI|nr:protein bric-a-brac 1-like isoform X4 [Trichoplusia ni]
MPAEEDPAAMECREPVDSPQQFCLRWNNYQSNLTSSFDQLLQTQSFVDVTLSCDGQSLKAHKVVLSACSPYFQSLFMDNPCQHPIIIMRDTKYCDLKAAVDFMYRGEINVSQEQIPALLKVAESLKIRGLTDVSGDHAVVQPGTRSAKRADRGREPDSPPKSRRRLSEDRASVGSSRAHQPTPSPTPATELLPPAEPAAAPAMPPLHPDDVDIRPGIAEMIREEERVRKIVYFNADNNFRTSI